MRPRTEVASDTAVTAGVAVSWAAVSRRGPRPVNEDRWAAHRGMFVVADGMGGHEAGEVASGLAVGVLTADLPDPLTAVEVVGRVSAAHATIRDAAGRSGRDMGSTLAGVALVGPGDAGTPAWLAFNVGDCRVYAAADGRRRRVSVDHSVVQELLDSGAIHPESAATHPERHMVTRALGTASPHHADWWTWPVTEGDRIVLCSDGMVRALGEATLLDLLGGDDLVAALSSAVATAEGGATPWRDDATALVLAVSRVPADAGVDEVTLPGAGGGAHGLPTRA